jgi:hypothetical protein
MYAIDWAMGRVIDTIDARARAFIEAQQLASSSDKRGEEGLRQYQREKNARSLDGLPALRWVEE